MIIPDYYECSPDEQEAVMKVIERHGLDADRIVAKNLVIGPDVLSGYTFDLDERGERIYEEVNGVAGFKKTAFSVPFQEEN